MQTMAGECGSGGGGGGNTVRTLQSKQSVPYAHIGDTELGLPFGDATHEDTCTCDGCAQARPRVLAGARALELEWAASVAGGDVCVVCAV